MGKLRINKFRKRFEKNGISVKEQLQEIQNNIKVNPDESSGVYIIHSKINDFIYIGSASRTFSLRWAEHIYYLKMLSHTNGLLQFLYCKYGVENLSFYILESCPSEDCLERESYCVNKYIPELNLNALLGTTGFDKEHKKEWDEWYITKEGKQYKRNTLTAKREKWVKTQVGKECVQQDIKNLRNRLNESQKSLDEKTEEILDYCREYFPDLIIDDKVLIEFINNGTHFEPIWSNSEETSSVKEKTKRNYPIERKQDFHETRKIKSKQTSTEVSLPSGCGFIIFLVILFILWLFIAS